MFFRIHEEKSAITWDNPYEKVDVVMRKQYEALQPYASINRLIHAGVSIRQPSCLTGISKKIIENALE